MNVETSQKILKIFGIIDIVFGIIGIIIGVLAFAGGGLVAAADETLAESAGMAVVAGVILLISGIVSLIQGIFSVRASKDTSKIMPAWIFAIIGLVTAVISLCTNFSSGAGAIVRSLGSVAISALIFLAANTIKKDNV